MSVQVTEAEWKIMECLWDHAPQTMGEITATLEPTTGWTRQTVITLLKRMTEKGAVSMDDSARAKKYGRSLYGGNTQIPESCFQGEGFPACQSSGRQRRSFRG